MKKSIITALTFFLCCAAAMTQERSANSVLNEEPVELSSHQIGLSLSSNQGIGLSYKHWFKRRVGFQASVLPVFIQNVGYFAGASFMYRFEQHKSHFPYASIGAIHLANRTVETNTDLTLFGIGAGYEFDIRESIVLNVKIDLTTAYDWEEAGVRFIPFPLPGVGIMYRL
ncbi:MAG: hypothetical protein ACQERC_04610 [Bacteroidota bacterium]